LKGKRAVVKYEAKSEVTGAVWKIVTAVGQTLEPGDTIMIIESMKMEIPVIAEEGGTIEEFRVEEGKSVTEGQVVAVLRA
jgi:acetyl-CoA carboxylase biotin carboxyl carrier protein